MFRYAIFVSEFGIAIPTFAGIFCQYGRILATADQNAKLVKFLKSRVYEKLAGSQPREFKELQELVESIDEGEKRSFSSQGKYFNIDWKIEKRNGVLKIRIDEYQNPKVGEKGYYPSGETPERLAFNFSRLVVAILEGVRNQIETDPSINKIEIIGGGVRNAELGKLLKSYGAVGKLNLKKINEIVLLAYAFETVGAYVLFNAQQIELDSDLSNVASIGYIFAALGIYFWTGEKSGTDWTLSLEISSERDG